MPTKIASFGNFTLLIRAKFPKLVIFKGPRTPKEIIQYGGAEDTKAMTLHAHPVQGDLTTSQNSQQPRTPPRPGHTDSGNSQSPQILIG